MSGGETIMRGTIDPFAFDMKKMINNKDMRLEKLLHFCYYHICSTKCAFRSNPLTEFRAFV